jgi:hypothetical protein
MLGEWLPFAWLDPSLPSIVIVNAGKDPDNSAKSPTVEIDALKVFIASFRMGV